MASSFAKWAAGGLLLGAAGLVSAWINADAPKITDTDLRLYGADVQEISATAAAKPDHCSTRRALCALLNYAEMRSELRPSRVPAPTRQDLAVAWAQYEDHARDKAAPGEVANLRDRYEEVLAHPGIAQ